jgi:hypothetical protein
MAKKQFGDITVIIPEIEEVSIPLTPAEPIKRKLSFEQWWATQKIPNHLFQPLKTHMEKKGFVESQDFAKGLKDFGL